MIPEIIMRQPRTGVKKIGFEYPGRTSHFDTKPIYTCCVHSGHRLNTSNFHSRPIYTCCAQGAHLLNTSHFHTRPIYTCCVQGGHRLNAISPVAVSSAAASFSGIFDPEDSISKLPQSNANKFCLRIKCLSASTFSAGNFNSSTFSHINIQVPFCIVVELLS